MTPLRVLLAEDDPDHRFFITRALTGVEGLPLDVVSVDDGEEALDYVHRRGSYRDRLRPHLIFLDLKMPRRSGLEVLEELKGDPGLRTIPVSVLSSSDRQEDVHAVYRLGANAYLRKRALPDLRSDLHAAARFWAEVAVLPPNVATS